MRRQKLGKKESAPSRDHWEDPRPQFLDWAESRGLENTFLGRLLLDADERFSIRRAMTVFAFCLVLSFLIFFQLRVPFDLRIGETSTVDVISPLAFEMVDEVTTEEKRQRAQQAVTEFYDYDAETFERVVSGIDRSFRLMRNFGREVKWPGSLLHRDEDLRPFFAQKSLFEKDLQASLPDDVFVWLVDNRYSSRIENALIRTLEQWYEHKIAELPERQFSPAEEFTARTLSRGLSGGVEIKVRINEILDLRDPEFFLLGNHRSLDRFNEGDRAHLLRLARVLTQPNLTLNKAETALRRQKARDDVLPVNISIKKNQSIVARGSSVQPFHMAIVRQIESLQAERRRGLMAVALAVLLATTILVFISSARRWAASRLKSQFKDILVMMLLAICQVFFTKVFLFVMDAAFLSRHIPWLTTDFFRALAPIAVAPMLVGLLVGTGEVVWLFTAFMAICMGIMEDFHFGFFLSSLLGGLAAARGVSNCKKRNDIYLAGVRTGLVNALVLAAMHLITRLEQDTTQAGFLLTVLAGFMGGIISSMFTMMIVPILESIFNYTTDVKLLELSNLNHPLLKEMIVKAPGTYHHSMMVGSMVEAAAEEIGANPLLGKVMCYYHDIGKMLHPNYFIENQKPGHNPHDHISPFMSKTLLVAHIKDGVELGMQHKLGKPIIDGILQHHGTTLISYFYNKALDQRQDGDAEFNEEEFRYPGPKPQFKEAALCMLADSIEAAARSLDEPTPARLQNLVRNIIQRKFTDAQLDECNLTLKDIAKIEAAFIRILLGIYHQRIDYPREPA